MARYIDKDAVVAEIERQKADDLQKKEQCKRRGLEKIMHQIGAYNKIISFLDTIEVKEVDLTEEIDKWWWDRTWQTDGMTLNQRDIRDFAKYFFELGMAASNEIHLQ